ncbi:MAG TPA: 7,8-didemethyl-8-hydroxy-5-deazariboflavin synthase CofG [Nitrososphaeraceae archaeon]|nr:7,8-didemethyl-8-hydroxy-5-deazariboflavin synthase CofG [Nitrososphaeraceae archaeon]HEU5172085.1 7,8-didemethyl-8-hydroxy-5-deazariboflavin synthase CofG [Nitrososphaeraceae archaeon]
MNTEEISSISIKDNLINEIFERCKDNNKKAISREEALYLLEYDDIMPLLMNLSTFLKANFKKEVVTYSRKIFINITNLCRDFCSYCTYRKNPFESSSIMMKPEEVINLAKVGRKYRCTEALIVAGERPEERYKESKEWINQLGYNSLVEYVIDISEKIVKETGLLPHSNLGNITKEEMKLLKVYNVSLGLMLESSSERLVQKDMAHEFAPSKNPKNRLEVIRNAGRTKIPLTTGLLIGIGETKEEVINDIFLLKQINNEFGNIQEIILQNFQPKINTRMQDFPSPTKDYFLKIVSLARLIMPDMNIQIPPNLSPGYYSRFLDAGINDWGGISPVTIDYVNPEFSWPKIKELKEITESKHQKLRARLPVYPEFIDKKGFISPELRNYINSFIDLDRLVKEEYI